MSKFILIGGIPRSGTNLTRRIIGSHSKIAIPPTEFQFLKRFSQGKSVSEILANEKLGQWNVDFSDLHDRKHREVFIDALVRYAESIGKEIPGEKSPLNEFFYDTIREWLNDFELRFIHVMRNPLDAIASLKHAAFRNVNRRRNTIDVSARSRNWVRSVSMGLARAHCNSEGYYLLKFEDLATDPVSTTQELCEFLGVDFEQERMLSLSDFEKYPDNTSFAQNRGKKHQEYGAIHKPESRKHYLTDSEIRIVSSICGELARALGYEDENLKCSPPERGSSGTMKKLRRAARNFLRLR